MATARKPRTKPRVEETEPKGSVRKNAAHRETAKTTTPVVSEVDNGWEITCQASELVPVAQYASVTVGPIAVKRTVVNTGDMADLKTAIQEVNEVLWDVIAEDRELIEESVRLHNQKQAEEEEKASKTRKR